jgi:hypothetical protein
LVDANPFWTEAVQRWGAQVIDCRANVPVYRALTIVRDLKPLPAGTLVILQLGHYDLHAQTSLLNPVGRQFAQASKDTTPAPKTLSKSVDRAQSTALSKRWATFLRGTMLLTLDRLLISKIRINKNINNIAAQFQLLIEELECAGADRIVVLSNFPTCSPRANYYRLIFSSLIKAITTTRGHVYVDLDWKEFSIGFGPFSLLRNKTALDADHLNACGHSVICQALAAQNI